MIKLPKFTLSCCLLTLLTFCAYSQHPSDSWETRLNRIQPPDKVLKTAGIEKGMLVGEIGAGTGRYAVEIAEKVGKEGLVYANDIDKEDLAYLDKRCKRDNVPNLITVIGELYDPLFPINDLDVIFLINTYHHLDDPVQILNNAKQYLKDDGRVVIVDADPEKQSYYNDHESTSKEEMLEQMGEAGYENLKIETYLKRDNIYIFKKQEN